MRGCLAGDGEKTTYLTVIRLAQLANVLAGSRAANDALADRLPIEQV